MTGRKTGTLFSIALCATLLIIASTTARAETPAVSIPDVERKMLLNGMQFLFFDGESEKVPFILMIKNGAAFDPADKWGATYLMVRMILANLADESIQREFTEADIEINSIVDWDSIYFIGYCPQQSLELALARLSDAIVRGEFDEALFERVRSQLIEEVAADAERLETKTERLFLEKIFPGNPYSRPVEGTAESLRGIYLRDIKIQYRRLMLPNQALLGLYFPEDREEFFRSQSRRWGSWVRDEAAPFTFRKSRHPDERQLLLIDQKGDEAYLRWGFLGVERKSPEYVPLKLLEHYLTLSLPDWAQALSSSSQIRGQAKLIGRRMPGYFQVSLQTSPMEMGAYHAKLRQTFQQIREGQIDPARFDEAKLLAAQEFSRALGDPLSRVRYFLDSDLYGLGVGYISTFGIRLDRVTLEVFRQRVQAALPEKASTLILGGPSDILAPQFAPEGEIELLN